MGIGECNGRHEDKGAHDWMGQAMGPLPTLRGWRLMFVVKLLTAQTGA